nr:MAG TPA: hypothetical protein [Bacteriophage sp.]
MHRRISKSSAPSVLCHLVHLPEEKENLIWQF